MQQTGGIMQLHGGTKTFVHHGASNAISLQQRGSILSGPVISYMWHFSWPIWEQKQLMGCVTTPLWNIKCQMTSDNMLNVSRLYVPWYKTAIHFDFSVSHAGKGACPPRIRRVQIFLEGETVMNGATVIIQCYWQFKMPQIHCWACVEVKPNSSGWILKRGQGRKQIRIAVMEIKSDIVSALICFLLKGLLAPDLYCFIIYYFNHLSCGLVLPLLCTYPLSEALSALFLSIHRTLLSFNPRSCHFLILQSPQPLPIWVCCPPLFCILSSEPYISKSLYSLLLNLHMIVFLEFWFLETQLHCNFKTRWNVFMLPSFWVEFM